MIYIIIPVFNRLHFTKHCIDSLLTQHYKHYTIIVVNDGSTDNTADYIRSKYKDVILLQGSGNLWWTGATNMGVEKALELSTAAGDFILTLNNDLEVNEHYLESLVAAAQKNQPALIGSVSVDINKIEKVHFAGTLWSATTAKYRPAVSKKLSYSELLKMGETIHTDLLPGRGVLIPINVFREIGLYDFASFPHYMADEDFAVRAKKPGYKLLVATKAVVYNHVNETGLKKQAKNFKFFKDVFTSIKSPVNFSNRWRWAKKHAAIFAPAYFLFDMTRIVKGVMSK